jgi:hypothetical protein
LNLITWERNFNLLLSESWIKLIIGSTITPLTIHNLPDLIERLNIWRKTRPVYHYFNSVDSPSYMFIDIFGDLFKDDFARAMELMPDNDDDSKHIKEYLLGITKQSCSTGINQIEITKLAVFLDEMDRRRKTSWRETFPWLIKTIDKVIA